MTDKKMIHTDITFESPDWEAHFDDMDEFVQTLARGVFDMAGFQKSPVELSFVFADDDFVQDLNKNYRGKDKPTNVLSFPQYEPEELAETTDSPLPLGDVILAFETIAREAQEQGKSLQDHTAHMIVHSLLHLLGYDHEEEVQAEAMEALEIRILNTLGIKNPYTSDEFMR